MLSCVACTPTSRYPSCSLRACVLTLRQGLLRVAGMGAQGCCERLCALLRIGGLSPLSIAY